VAETPEERWTRREYELSLFDPPLDDGVRDLVIALQLLDFPTIGSCAGHAYVGGELMFPFVGIRYRLPRRFEADPETGCPSPLWLDPKQASLRERTYLAALARRVYRPLAWRLRDLLREYDTAAEFHVHASWYGLALEPRDLDALDAYESLPERTVNEILSRWSRAVCELGGRLRQAWLSGRLAAAAAERRLYASSGAR
jgi:hypothetical protein